MIFLQIVNGEALSANWVLVVIAAICGALMLVILNDIRGAIKSIINRQNAQEKDITKTTARTDFAHKRIDEILLKIKQ